MYEGANRNEIIDLLNFYKKNGIIVEFESLVTCESSEAYMLSDHIKSINYLNFVFVHLPDIDKLNMSSESLFQMEFEKYFLI